MHEELKKLQVIQAPKGPWVDRLREDCWIWLVKENEPALVLLPYYPLPGNMGRIAFMRVMRPETMHSHVWDVDNGGNGYDGQPLIRPCAGHLPTYPQRPVEPEWRAMMRTLDNLGYNIINHNQSLHNQNFYNAAFCIMWQKVFGEPFPGITRLMPEIMEYMQDQDLLMDDDPANPTPEELVQIQQMGSEELEPAGAAPTTSAGFTDPHFPGQPVVGAGASPSFTTDNGADELP